MKLKAYRLRNNEEIDYIEACILVKEMDRAMSIAKQILAFYDCERCGACCKIPVYLSDNELDKFLKVEGESFLDKLDPNEVHNYLKKPCPYLNDTFCTIYNEDYRPEICSTYPFSRSHLRPTLALCPLGKKIAKEFIPFLERLRGLKIKINETMSEGEWKISQQYENFVSFMNFRNPEDLRTVKPVPRLLFTPDELELFLKWKKGQKK